jgi:hypothetical protein
MPSGKNRYPLKPQPTVAPGDHERLLNRVELAHKLACSPSQIENLRDSGLIPYYKIRGMVRYSWPEVIARLQRDCRQGEISSPPQKEGDELPRVWEQVAKLNQKVEELLEKFDRFSGPV